MDLSSKRQNSLRISPPSNTLYTMVLLLLIILQLLSMTSAYTCSFTGREYGRLLCRHGTKSTSGVFDARRITILYSQEGEEPSGKLESSPSAAATVMEQESDTIDTANHQLLSKREKLQRLLQHMRDVAPKLRICLPSFMARIKSIETELEHEESDSEETVSLETINEAEMTTNGAEEESLDAARSATAASHVDLSGTWRPIVTPEFKAEYDQYLQNCSQSFMYRKIIVNGIALQKEIISQLEHGKDLQIVASNPAGNWNRTLVASSSQDPVHVSIQDPDGDMVEVEAWWENSGRVHKSWLRNKPRLLGGTFETARYLSPEDPNILLCDSIFHPGPDAKGFKYGHVLWKFQREA